MVRKSVAMTDNSAMKNLFRKTPMVEDQIAHFQKRAGQLGSMREKAKNVLDRAIAAQQERLLSGDIDDRRGLDRLREAGASATMELASIDDALAVLSQQKAEAEAKLTSERALAECLKAS